MYSIFGAAIGYFLTKSIYGGFIGFVVGGFLDKLSGGRGQQKERPIFGNGQQSARQGRSPFEWNTQERVTPSDFELNLLSLASIVIKADGKVSQTELDYVRQYFVRSYGKERANATFKTFNDVIKSREVSAARVSQYLASRTQYESRLQILHFLFGIAQADGSVSASEVRTLQSIAGYLRINTPDFTSIKAMFIREQDNAYKILEIPKNASNADVKKAYRTMAKKYHPDKVGHLGEAHRKMAEEKFKEVQKAYEKIQDERGL